MNDETPAIEPTHRRDFVKSLTLGTAGAALVSGTTRADDAKEAKKPSETSPEKAKPAEPAASEVEARMQIVLARFGKHKQLDDEAKASIKAEIAGLVRRAEALRKIPVGNGDGPFPVFRPYRAPLSSE
jgi:hypothetical protein